MEKIKMMVCKKHGLTEYYLSSEGRYRCKKCNIESINERRRFLKKELVRYKGGKCEICGYDDCIAALEFHHLNPEEKDFGIGNGNIKSLEKLKKEVDKCILVCNRCHKEIHYKEWEEREAELQAEIQNNIENFEENCKKYNIENHDNYYKKFSLNKEEIKTDIENKLTQKEIAQKYNISLASVKRFLYENCFDKPHKRLNFLTIEEFIQIALKHHFIKTLIAKELGFSVKALEEWCIRNGLPRKRNDIKKYIETYNSSDKTVTSFSDGSSPSSDNSD